MNSNWNTQLDLVTIPLFNGVVDEVPIRGQSAIRIRQLEGFQIAEDLFWPLDSQFCWSTLTAQTHSTEKLCLEVFVYGLRGSNVCKSRKLDHAQQKSDGIEIRILSQPAPEPRRQNMETPTYWSLKPTTRVGQGLGAAPGASWTSSSGGHGRPRGAGEMSRKEEACRLTWARRVTNAVDS